MVNTYFFNRVPVWGGLVKFSHTVFALPFALVMTVVVARTTGITPLQLVLIVTAVAAARTAAMAFNRFIDASIDAKNPRTASREIPSGKIARGEALLLTVVAGLGFFAAAAGLGGHCLVLAPPVLAVLIGYSYLKRVSALCHFVLGLALALAPGGVWYALTATWSWRPVPLMLVVLLWVAGFDILYSCQDLEFDTREGLHSVPRYLGLEGAIALASVLHLATIPLLILFGSEFGLGRTYGVGVGVFAVLLLSQYESIRRQGIASIDQVFFTRNGMASILLLLFVTLDAL